MRISATNLPRFSRIHFGDEPGVQGLSREGVEEKK